MYITLSFGIRKLHGKDHLELTNDQTENIYRFIFDIIDSKFRSLTQWCTFIITPMHTLLGSISVMEQFSGFVFQSSGSGEDFHAKSDLLSVCRKHELSLPVRCRRWLSTTLFVWQFRRKVLFSVVGLDTHVFVSPVSLLLSRLHELLLVRIEEQIVRGKTRNGRRKEMKKEDSKESNRDCDQLPVILITHSRQIKYN